MALVTTPRIEISLHGENVGELVDWIRNKFEVTEYGKVMEKNLVCNPFAGARLKADLTQD